MSSGQVLYSAGEEYGYFCFLTSGARMRSALMCAWMRTGSEKEAKKACFERKALSRTRTDRKKAKKYTKLLT